jgi:hypothetical protein
MPFQHGSRCRYGQNSGAADLAFHRSCCCGLEWPTLVLGRSSQNALDEILAAGLEFVGADE